MMMAEHVPQSTMEAASVLWNIARAFLARLLFVIHSFATVWQTSQVTGAEWLWGFALLILLVVFEGSHTIIMRAGDERKWFCTSVLLYVLATAPPIWMLERHLCDFRAKAIPRTLPQESTPEEEELRVQMVEQLMLVVLIVGRWLLPKGEISSEQLSQILLAYLAIASDIVEFFDVFKEPVVYTSRTVQHLVLFAWTLSLLQFPFVITVSRARKMRVAITSMEEAAVVGERRGSASLWDLTHDVDIWAIVLANALQDVPFLLVRLYLMVFHRLNNYTMIFFTCKNALIIVLQTYRAFVLISDRYMKKSVPKPDKQKGRKKRRGTRGRLNGAGREDEEMMLSVEPPPSHTHTRQKKQRKQHNTPIERERSPARSGSLETREMIGSGGSSGGDHNRNAQRSTSKGRRKDRSRESDRGRERERHRDRESRDRDSRERDRDRIV